MTTAIVQYRELTPERWQMIQQVAPAMRASSLFGVTEPQAAAIMLKGYELGFSLTASFENIVVIEGKPTLAPKGALALIQNSPLCAGIKIEDEIDTSGAPFACKVWMKRRNGFEYTARFTIDDAKRAGLVKEKSGWDKYPANMLRWRAIGYCADVVFPDVIGGMKRADEFGAEISPNGEIIETTWQPAITGGSQTAGAQTLDSLLKRYGADAIMQANDGRIPANDAELTAVGQKLKASNGE